ncbi:competence protein ComK [Alteribacter natronophilus]|uniref:competence protein ComK n=1 Tax=Alteribacter natronophilus TaxID=2583810 RepID=UPI00110E8E1A|nr:competence protein ComK [Alteribacter natronophilus]TMW72378.1 hypothetical protein FGB90_09240 [Alteribacter natronophilus]
MKEVFTEDYQAGYQTLILMPNIDPVYVSKAVETDRVVYIAKPCLKIIEDACLTGGASYNGRREAVFYHTGFQKRVPVPLSVSKRVCAFPTQSPNVHGCAWIFSQHLRRVTEIEKETPAKKRALRSRVHFSSGQEIDVNVSKHILDKQMTRASHCMNLFTKL